MNKKIWLSSPHMGTEEFLNVKNAFETNWIAPLGPHVDGFEKDLATYINVEHVAALSSGTSAIHLALSFTFSASANPINYQGATPVFIDSEKETWNMSPEFLREAIIDRIANGKKPKAIIVVHLYGMPAKMAEIVKIADEFQIPIIEDAAEALGSFYQNKACGSFGKFGILSFNGNKIITTSGGGALCSNDKLLIDKSRFLATQARDQAPHYQHSEIGFNYRMSNVLAAIGRGQMKVLKDRILKRRENYQFYFNQLSSIEGIKFLEEPKESLSNRWLTTILVDPKKTNGCDREKIRTQLEKVNIETRPLWKPMHLQPIFKDFPYYGSDVSEQLFDIGLCLPSGSNLVFEDLDFVVNSIKNLF